jgi:hypothetical protein
VLIRFAVGNHRSIKEPVELSLVAVDEDRAAVRHFERLPEGILTLAAIYGPNASGKSNVLDALSWVSSAVRNSLRAWDDLIPRDPFRFAGGTEAPSVYEIDFIVDGVRHIYSLQVSDEAVLFEELISYPERRPRQLFVREGQELHFRRGTAGAGGVRELLTPTTLVLALAQRFALAELKGPARFVSNISAPFMRRRPYRRSIGFSRFSEDSGLGDTARIFLAAHRASISAEAERGTLQKIRQGDLDAALALLRYADLGIDDVEVVQHDDSGRSRLELRLVHRSGEERALFELDEESDGTQMWFRLLGPALVALRTGIPMLLDEIDASLHPILSARLLELFRDPKVNKANAQLIFTTHDTTLLGELNRDEVWLTEKSSQGATTLTPLAAFGGDRVRKSLNLERAYLQGRFGAVPKLRESTLNQLTWVDSEEAEGSPDELPDLAHRDAAESGEDDQS